MVAGIWRIRKWSALQNTSTFDIQRSIFDTRYDHVTFATRPTQADSLSLCWRPLWHGMLMGDWFRLLREIATASIYIVGAG
jgi:hypothetical protein